MPRPARHRGALIRAAVKLFREQGYAATGLAEILAESGAPRGSLYHYFPGGKEALGAAAVRAAGAVVLRTLEDIAADVPDAGAFLRAYGERLAGWMAASQWRAGCPIATTLLETVPASEAITAAGNEVLDAWTGLIASVHERDGMAADAAARRAEAVIAAVEGALILARVRQSGEPLRRILNDLAAG
ncbi:MAG: helix-turn-helix domain-containing protein [Pseudomonadales bacterium]|jgi:TetR/AcrR family transcriptional repressor of lmrAB and yxaGH operons|nr:helix-turn-helix domain-containing protein [Pseudomonadales bacterium]